MRTLENAAPSSPQFAGISSLNTLFPSACQLLESPIPVLFTPCVVGQEPLRFLQVLIALGFVPRHVTFVYLLFATLGSSFPPGGNVSISEEHAIGRISGIELRLAGVACLD